MTAITRDSLSTRDTDNPIAVPLLGVALFGTGYGLTKFGGPNYEPSMLDIIEMGVAGVLITLFAYAVINYYTSPSQQTVSA